MGRPLQRREVEQMKAVDVAIRKGRIFGHITPGFEPLLESFARNFNEFGDVGAACTVYHRGDRVADLWGGLADEASGRPWEENTVTLVFSAAKGPTATCINRLAEQGLLDVDVPLASYWPEFGCNGKEQITTRQVLSHRAGLAAVEGELSLEQVLAWDPVVEAIAAQAPNWEPGAYHGYHARSFGWILGELIRRITGLSAGQYLAREISEPLGLRYWVGLPEEELGNCARLIPPQGGSDAVAELLGADSLTARVMSGPNQLFGYNEMWNRPDVLAAEMPSSNGVGDARSLAYLYATLIEDGNGLLGAEQLARACEENSRGPDAVIFHETCFGLGYMLQPSLAPGAGPDCFGHPGAGGAVAFADPGAQLSFAYVMNAMQFNLEGDPRAVSLVKAAYESLPRTA
jgi:CubicO group peptidase (beta-lactamase class C family)